ncbi:TetR/AcrR family transcriptional regulator [Nocardia miyunensis]|uniref:TetR/AcrR family transcriptional regulator n=1 Tax=Nocardia miyunensis TaxID=282684 RepID=UPI00082B433F|nr:TetR/AcrR family transcriptional regulator [Nocardia miyunensis]
MRLLRAAIELFAEKGYERTTAAEIGIRAGFSRNMVRDRYGSKEALLQSLFDSFGEHLLPIGRRERTGDGLNHVLSQLDDLAYSIRNEPEAMRAMIVLSFETPGPLGKFAPWLEDLIAGYQRELAEHLALGQLDGSVRRDLDPVREAEVFVSYAIGLCFRSALLREAYDFPGEVDAWRLRLEDHLRSTP